MKSFQGKAQSTLRPASRGRDREVVMFANGIAIIIVGLMAYIWLTRGFFSALIHLICTVIAGAIAFGLWEKASLFLIAQSPNSGFFSFVGTVAWGLGLALPFAVSLGILRLIVDSCLRANVNPGTAADYTGGAICGTLAGVIASGITMISLGFLRLGPDFTSHVGFAQRGYIVRVGDGVGGLLVPTDKLTSMFYGMLSERAFRTPDALAQYYPSLEEVPTTLRLTALEGKGRNTTRPEDFEMMGRFTVGKAAPLKMNLLLRDRWSSQAQEAKDINGDDYPEGSYIEGYVVKFLAGAKEKDGKVAIGGAQVRLVLQSTTSDFDRLTVFPIACASQAESASVMAGRWRFDSEGTFIASVGGASEAPFAFEFVVPPGYQPFALYVKNIRHVISEGVTATAKNNFRSTDERDAFLVRMAGGTGTLPISGGVADPAAPGESGDAVKIGTGQPIAEGAFYEPEGVRISARLPFTLQDGTLRILEISSEGDKVVINGEEKFELTYPTQKSQGLEKALRIERFQTNADTNIVQVDVDATSKASLLGKAAEAATGIMPPVLIDTNGQRYEPIGYVYYDEQYITIRFTPGEPIRALKEVPTLSKSRPAQKLTLIFRVSYGATVDRFALGTKAIAIYDPPFIANQEQMR